MAKTLSWRPRKNGRYYCSSACGGHCLWTDYERVRTDAVALAKRLGKGWKIELRENLGWHYSVVNTSIGTTVNSYGGAFSAVMGGNFIAHAKTPETAILMVHSQIKATVVEYKRIEKSFAEYWRTHDRNTASKKR